MMKIIALVVLVILAIWLAPLAEIWALNVLFVLAIPYTLKTWAAALILSAPFASNYKGDLK